MKPPCSLKVPTERYPLLTAKEACGDPMLLSLVSKVTSSPQIPFNKEVNPGLQLLRKISKKQLWVEQENRAWTRLSRGHCRPLSPTKRGSLVGSHEMEGQR